MSGADDVSTRLAALRARVAAAAERAAHPAQQVTLVGVAKSHGAARVVEAVAAGLADVAESFAQEAREKLPEVAAALRARGLAPPRWHFVGRLQRNKARDVVALFDCVESLDREALARELDRRAAELGRAPFEVLIQVNLSGEAQKGGVAPDQVPGLLAACVGLAHLRVVGLMTVPARPERPEASRPAFAALRALRDRLCTAPGGDTLRELSMGMSDDFEVAVEEGATRVRVGTALFGARVRA